MRWTRKREVSSQDCIFLAHNIVDKTVGCMACAMGYSQPQYLCCCDLLPATPRALLETHDQEERLHTCSPLNA